MASGRVSGMVSGRASDMASGRASSRPFGVEYVVRNRRIPHRKHSEFDLT